jgi:MraZ protein
VKGPLHTRVVVLGSGVVSLDQKGRLAIPAKYRNALLENNETQIVITKDPQYPSLKIYPKSQWIEISSKLESLQGLDPIVRNLQWTILGNASVTEFDPGGRMLILIPIELRKYADLVDQKQISLIGMGNKFEIWNVNNWEMRQTGGSLATEILDVVLPESIKSMSF